MRRDDCGSRGFHWLQSAANATRQKMLKYLNLNLQPSDHDAQFPFGNGANLGAQ
jgi:hypothetical protein